LKNPIEKRSTRPTKTAIVIELIKPPMFFVTNQNSKPPAAAPNTLMKMLGSGAIPPFFINVPVRQPAQAPITENMIKPVISIASPLEKL
jgi:hypothetical protein